MGSVFGQFRVDVVNHLNPEEAIVDGQQTVTTEELKRIIKNCLEIRHLMAI